MMEAYPGIDQTAMFAVLRRSMEQRVHGQLENEFIFPDGSKGWFDLRFEPVPEGMFILSLEITARKAAEARVAHLNAVLRGLRNVDQLITRERDRDVLIRRTCELLVEARGFEAVVIGLTDPSGERAVAYTMAGRSLPALAHMLESGDLPDCAREAVATRAIVRRSKEHASLDCAISEEVPDHIGVLTVSLDYDNHLYGFLVACVPIETEGSAEEQELLREIARDVAFALHAIEVRDERDRSAAALADVEAQLRQAQKLEAVGRLAGGMAHDFNNILAAQLGYCEIMRNALRDEDPLAYDLDRLKQCTERAAALTRQLLAFSRKQPLQVEVLDLNAVVRDVEEMLGRLIGEDIELVTNLADDVGRVKADPSQVEQIIMNLAVNARDAMPHGGRLTIATANVELDDTYVRSHIDAASGPHVMLSISDTGVGMSVEIQNRLFEPFFTTKEQGKGTGLGLATVYGIVKQFGGNIWVYSEPDLGATFKIYLPQTAEIPAQRTRRSASEVRGRGELILLVEDDDTLRDLLARMLRDLGYEVRTAPGGYEALAVVETQGLEPDLLLTDVVMPGMSGRKLAEQLAPILPGLRVLFTSGYADDAVVEHGSLDPGTAYLQKPFGRLDLATKLRDVLDQS
jgi:signal transduction histidine kinase